MSADDLKAKTFKCGTCDHFNRGCTAPVPFWAEPHGRPRIYSEDTGCEVHSQLAAAPAALDTPAPALMDELVEALRAVVNEALIKQENDSTMWVPEWQIWASDARAILAILAKLDAKP
jgi:hypothetical protein